MKKNHYKTNKGFTIIEMLVSIAIFSVIIVLGMTATLSMINANRKSQSSTLILSNLSLAIEAMTKNIRVGSNYTVTNGGATIQFTPSSGSGTVTYSYDSTAKTITRSISTVVQNPVPSITAPEVEITSLKFIPRTTGQPSVLMLIEGTAGTKDGTKSKFFLQSMISQRLITTL